MAAHTVSSDPAIMAKIRDMHTLANKARALLAEISDLKITWDASLGASFGNNADTWDEGRSGEGIVPVTSLQINQLTGELFKGVSGANLWNPQIISAMSVGLLAAQ